MIWNSNPALIECPLRTMLYTNFGFQISGYCHCGFVDCRPSAVNPAIDCEFNPPAMRESLGSPEIPYACSMSGAPKATGYFPARVLEMPKRNSKSCVGE